MTTGDPAAAAATLTPADSVTCHKCGNVCTVASAVETALASGAVKKLSDHRVVQV